MSNFDLNNHYDPGIRIIEKFDANKVWSAALFDADQGYPYLKRFTFESTSRRLNYLGDKIGKPFYIAYLCGLSTHTSHIRRT